MKRIALTLTIVTILLLSIIVAAAPSTTEAQENFDTTGPRIDELVIKIYLSPEPEFMALEAGEIDIIDWPLTSAKIEEFMDNPDIVLAEYTELGMFEFDFNNRRWPMSNLNFRKAIAHLVDKDRIVTEVVKGYGMVLDSIIGPQWGDLYNPNVPKYEYDPELAAQLLDEAGFVMGPDGWRIDPQTGETLRPLVFIIRADDPLRSQAGLMLVEELENIGIPVDEQVVDRTIAYEKVMTEYDYDIYTGGWILDRDGTYLYDLYTSYIDVYPEPWSLNYIGFNNSEFDYWAYQMKYNSSNFEEFKEAAWRAQEIFMEQVPMIPLWSTAGVKAYRADLRGVINMVGQGVNNVWTFLNVYREGEPLGGTINYGFKSDVETLNPVTAQWYWDHEVLNKVFDTLIAVDPYDLQHDIPWLAESWTVEFTEDGTIVTYKLRNDVLWQDGVPLTSEDVKFTIELYKEWSPYWLSYVEHIVNVETPDLYTVICYFDVKSYIAYRWPGAIYILPKHIWENYDDPTAARPWEEEHPTVSGLTKLIGTGPFIFKEWRPGEYIHLVWNPKYFARNPAKIMSLEVTGEELQSAVSAVEQVEEELAAIRGTMNTAMNLGMAGLAIAIIALLVAVVSIFKRKA